MLGLTFRPIALVLCIPVIAFASPNAADLYMQAAKNIVVYSPTETDGAYPSYPPYGPEWDKLAKAAFEKNAAMRDLARRARSIDTADWAAVTDPNALNRCRSLANELADAATYQQVHGDDAGAFETFQDLLHLAAMLRYSAVPAAHPYLRATVGGGIDALACARLLCLTPDVKITRDSLDLHALQYNTAFQAIEILLDQADSRSILAAHDLDPSRRDRFVEVLNRCNAERTFAAMSLACQLFRFEQHRWPASLNDLIPLYLPQATLDPWGDGRQTFGYVLIKSVLPDASDRPLIYNRCASTDGLFYRAGEPQYFFYSDDGSGLIPSLQKHGGQFRDVARWTPTPKSRSGPATRPLE